MENDFFVGGVMLGLLASVIAAMRVVPKELWRLIQRHFTPTVHIRDEQLVRWVSDYLAATSIDTRWWIAEVMAPGVESRGEEVLMKPGEGLHVVTRFGKRFMVWSNLEDNGIVGKVHTITIRCYGRDPAPIRQLLEETRVHAELRKVGRNSVFINTEYGEWRQVRLAVKRPLSTVVLNASLRDRIVADLGAFLDSRDMYSRRGTPFRRGYLFQGPPGNGKSSMVQALASEFGLPIYALSLVDSRITDHKLAESIGRIPERSILLLEDVDRVDLSETAVTLSGLLNAIDGALATEGRLLLLTANDPAKLDKAIVRPGRIDCVWDFECPDEHAILEMASLWGVEILERPDPEMSMAEIQAWLGTLSAQRNLDAGHCRGDREGRGRTGTQVKHRPVDPVRLFGGGN